MRLMKYSEILDLLNGYKEERFAQFQRQLIPTKQTILGVRTPILRNLAKEYKNYVEDFLTFPDEFYEVTFLKLTIVSLLPYERFCCYVEKCVEWIDNWATCDSFRAKCVKKHKAEFLPILEKIFQKQGEFSQRYVLVVLLFEYLEEEYLKIILSYIEKANKSFYYVHMAVAWLTAEICIKYFDFGISILKSGVLPIDTHNKSIQKSLESYRLTKEQKDCLRSLKIKNSR